MVNTFLVRGNYAESARLLDRQRLGKQRVEAQQILNALEQLRFVAKHLGLPDFPENQMTPLPDRTNWISKVVSTFNANWSGVWIRKRLVVWIPKGGQVPYKPKGDLYLKDGMIYEKSKTGVVWSGSAGSCLLPDDTYITMGWKSHTAVRMWLGLEPTLRIYINDHIREWIRRGYQNTMPLQPEDPRAYHPDWARDDSPWTLCCKQNLLFKELERKEPPWYVHMPDFVQLYTLSPEYFWQ